jgi:hypothetical protein
MVQQLIQQSSIKVHRFTSFCYEFRPYTVLVGRYFSPINFQLLS